MLAKSLPVLTLYLGGCTAFTSTSAASHSCSNSNPTVLKANTDRGHSFLGNSTASAACTTGGIVPTAKAAEVPPNETNNQIQQEHSAPCIIALWGYGNQNKLVAK
jgi:hypothetical protein